MNHRIIRGAVLFTGIISGLVLVSPTIGRAEAPATHPTAPASAPVAESSADFSSPIAAMRSFTIALNRGDPDVLRRVLYAGDERSRTYADALIDTAVSVERIRLAAIEVLGQEAGQQVQRPYGPDLRAGDPIAGATADIKADQAMVHFHGQAIPFQKIQGQWKLAVGRMAVLFRYPTFPARWRRNAEVWTALAEKVKAGQYKSLDEVENAMKAEQKRVDNAASGGQYGPIPRSHEDQTSPAPDQAPDSH